jgi:indolepyruvate ferredoxin oxidoreductase, alpha subunit
MVEKGFELSEATHAPVMLDLRVRACHLTGEFIAKDNKSGLYNARHRLAGPVRFEYGRLAHPPATFAQERLKIEQRLPAAQKFIGEQKLNELIAGEIGEIGIIVLGGLTNGVLRALVRIDLADLYGASRIPIYVLNVAYPLVPHEVREFYAAPVALTSNLEAEIAGMPAPAQDIIAEGVRRLTAYQDRDYARLYLDRLS